MAKGNGRPAPKQVSKPITRRSNPMTPKAGFTVTRRRYGEGGKIK